MTNRELAAIVVERLHARFEDMGLSEILWEVTSEVLSERNCKPTPETEQEFEQCMDICSRIYLISE